MQTFEELIDQLHSRKFRMSEQRMRILKYLYENQCHPTAEQIYSALHKEMPSLSKTTVYNTLNALLQSRAVEEIRIEDKETRYDIVVKNHGHFKCKSCGEIFNFDINLDEIPSRSLEGFLIDERNVCFRGICPKCLLNKSSK